MNKTQINELRIKVGAAVVLAASVLVIHLFDPKLLPEVWRLTLNGDVDELILFLRPYGIWAMIISLVIDILINALGFLPSIFISTANGVLFGIVPGILISWIAESIGVIISFYLMRSVLRNSAEKLISKSPYLKKVDEFSSRNGFKMMVIARSVPYFPSGMITALGAVSHISARDYIMATFVGKFPSTAIEVIVGHDIVTYEEHTFRLFIVVLMVVLGYGALWWNYQRKQKSALEKARPDNSDTD